MKKNNLWKERLRNYLKGAIGNVSHNPFPIIPKIDVTSLSFLKKLSDETVLHLFYKCNIILNLRNELDLFFENEFTLFDLTPQAAFLGFLNVDSKLLLIQNHLLLIFKICIYNSRRSESLKIKPLTLKRTGFLGGPIWNGGRAKMPPLLFSKIINAATLKFSTNVAHLKYFKKMWWKYWGSRNMFADIISFSRILWPLDVKVGTF